MNEFPNDFWWGASTASYQVEGYNENCDWAEAGKRGRVPIAGRLADQLHRYEEDFDLARELGHTAHRLSVEWARIEPREGEFDLEAIEHYRAVMRALRKRKIEPIVTLWHFSLPIWFAEKGGFEHKDAPVIFARYCTYVVEMLQAEVTHFSTLNEPNVFASNGWLRGEWPPFKRFSLANVVQITNQLRTSTVYTDEGIRPFFAYWRVLRNLTRAHNAAYRSIKATVPDAEVSVVKNVVVFTANRNPFNRMAARLMNYLWTHWFMRRVHRHCDVIGLNYYFYHPFGDHGTYDKSDMGWDMHPEHIYDALKLLARYKKPLFVSEAGVADETDTFRADYITKQITGIARALREGIPVRGHLYWSLIDNYEWAFGVYKRFGLIAVDYDTLERTVRPSAYVYKTLIDQATGRPPVGTKTKQKR